MGKQREYEGSARGHVQIQAGKSNTYLEATFALITNNNSCKKKKTHILRRGLHGSSLDQGAGSLLGSKES